MNGTWKALRQRWQGQHLTWTVTRYRALCGSAEQCNIAAFPIQHGTGHGATSGWMPIVKFAPGQYDAMATACGDREQCEINIEGVLSDLDAGGESATKMTLSDVKLSTKIATR